MTARSPTMVALHDNQFVECRWWSDGWAVKTVVIWRLSASMIPAPGDWAITLQKQFETKGNQPRFSACAIALFPG